MKTYGTIPKTLLNACLKFQDVIDEIGNEGTDGYWIYTKAGYSNHQMDKVHCIHEYTIARCISQLSSIKKCDCKDCIQFWTNNL